VDDGGKKLAEKTVEETSVGHGDALHWAATRFDGDLRWGVEDNRAVTGLLEQDLLASGMKVHRVPPELTAAKLISESGDVTRFRNEAAYARYVGIAPVPGWSGSTRDRLRVSRAGIASYAALHRIAIVQLAMPSSAARAYFDRRRANGDSGATVLRGLKRRLCRVVYNRLRDDQQRRQLKS
jgi:hypothetical protein